MKFVLVRLRIAVLGYVTSRFSIRHIFINLLSRIQFCGPSWPLGDEVHSDLRGLLVCWSTCPTDQPAKILIFGNYCINFSLRLILLDWYPWRIRKSANFWILPCGSFRKIRRCQSWTPNVRIPNPVIKSRKQENFSLNSILPTDENFEIWKPEKPVLWCR